jgi:hypothetical protein
MFDSSALWDRGDPVHQATGFRQSVGNLMECLS